MAFLQKLYHAVIGDRASAYLGLLSQNLRNRDFAITLIETRYHAPKVGAIEITHMCLTPETPVDSALSKE